MSNIDAGQRAPVAVQHPAPEQPRSPRRFYLWEFIASNFKIQAYRSIEEHIAGTYYSLRLGIILTALFLPILLVFIGWWYGVKLQGSMSAYYHTTPLLRDIFVGAMCIIGAFLWLYKGYNDVENYTYNFAGICAIVLALSPTQDNPITVHGVAALLMALSIALLCIYIAIKSRYKTVSTEDNEDVYLLRTRSIKLYRNLYLMWGVLMLVLPLITVGLSLLNSVYTQVIHSSRILWLELIVIWVFGGFWITKSVEMYQAQEEVKEEAEKLQGHQALKEQVKRNVHPDEVVSLKRHVEQLREQEAERSST